MSRKPPESNVHKLFPEPKIEKWLLVKGDIYSSVEISFVKEKKQRKIRFEVVIPSSHKGRFRYKIEVVGVEGAEDLTQKEIAKYRREAKDVLADFYEKMKREKKP